MKQSTNLNPDYNNTKNLLAQYNHKKLYYLSYKVNYYPNTTYIYLVS